MKKFYAFAAAAAVALSANAQVLYITGAGEFANGEWNAETPDQFEIVDGKYQIEVGGLTQFKLSTECGSWDAFNAGVYGCSYGDTPGVEVALEAGYTDNIATPWKGDYKIVVSADLSTIVLTTDTPAPTGPATIYLRGDMNGWGADEAWALTSLGNNVYKFEFGADQAINVGEAFKIADADWNEINVGGNGEALMLETEIEVYNGGNPANMTIEEACNGVVWLTLDYEGSAYIALSNDKTYVPGFYDDSAVETVEVENAPVVYYNLQGARVVNPSNGIYVKVVGNKASKVLVKE